MVQRVFEGNGSTYMLTGTPKSESLNREISIPSILYSSILQSDRLTLLSREPIKTLLNDISVVLIIIMVASFVQYLKKTDQTTPQNSETTGFSANIDVNISCNESTTNDTTENLTTEGTSNIAVP